MALKIEEYISTLPPGTISGNDVELPPHALRRMLELAGAGSGDTVMHLGCGHGEGLKIALEEFGVDAAIGVEIDEKKVEGARKMLKGVKGIHEVLCGDAVDADVSVADVVFFWFADLSIVDRFRKTLSALRDGARVVSVRIPPARCMPERIDYPFVRCVAPLDESTSAADQSLAVFGVKCVDFVTAWECSERYTRAVGPPDVNEGNRFLTMMQAVSMWMEARNLGITCTEEMPESIRTYVGILRTFFGIETEHLLVDSEKSPGA